MNYRLRKRHQFIWMAWAVLIPLALLVAYSALPQQKIPIEAKTLYPGINANANELLAEKQVEGIQWKLWKGTDTPLLLEGIVQQSLRNPAAFVYLVPEKEALISKGEILGKLGPQGSYSFPLDSTWNTLDKMYVVLHDPVHQKTLQTIELVP